MNTPWCPMCFWSARRAGKPSRRTSKPSSARPRASNERMNALWAAFETKVRGQAVEDGLRFSRPGKAPFIALGGANGEGFCGRPRDQWLVGQNRRNPEGLPDHDPEKHGPRLDSDEGGCPVFRKRSCSDQTNGLLSYGPLVLTRLEATHYVSPRAQVAELVTRWFQVPVVQAVKVRVLSWSNCKIELDGILLIPERREPLACFRL